MKLALFDDYRLGVVTPDETALVDVTDALPWPHDPDPQGAGWWVRLCRDFAALRERLAAAARGTPRSLASVRLRAPVLNPSKIVAAASNYHAHVEEMHAVLERTAGGVEPWLMEFDVFLKAPSSIIGPEEAVVLPAAPLAAGKEIHHESELAVVIGRGGRHIPEHEALAHVLGYTIGLDMTVRGTGDRSRRKSYDTFTPLGPWLVTADEIADPHALHIHLTVNGTTRQDVNTRDMVVKIPGIIAYASSVMRLEPGDVILTGAPPGVGQVRPGDVLETRIAGIGRMRQTVVAAEDTGAPG
ncbi:MAG: fumarylacetoacetate hydrolase family protein [Chloroflexi bacterium]|nr:fumarylacetoacetate hydrolase family protein [Chloroflexota bacterium]